MGDARRLDEGLLGGRRIPKVAFEVKNGGRDVGRVQIGAGQILAGAEKSVHRPLAVRRDQDETARRGRPIRRRRGGEMHAGGPNVVGEGAARLIRRDLSDKGAHAAEARQASDRIGRRSARYDRGRAHRIVKPLRPLFVDELHRALVQSGGDEKFLVNRGDHVDNGIAKTKDIKMLRGH